MHLRLVDLLLLMHIYFAPRPKTGLPVKERRVGIANSALELISCYFLYLEKVLFTHHNHFEVGLVVHGDSRKKYVLHHHRYHVFRAIHTQHDSLYNGLAQTDGNKM